MACTFHWHGAGYLQEEKMIKCWGQAPARIDQNRVGYPGVRNHLKISMTSSNVRWAGETCSFSSRFKVEVTHDRHVRWLLHNPHFSGQNSHRLCLTTKSVRMPFLECSTRQRARKVCWTGLITTASAEPRRQGCF